MRNRLLTIAPCIVLSATSLFAQNAFDPAARAAILEKAPGIRSEQIQLPSHPTPSLAFEGVHVSAASYDPTLKEWRVRLSCVPTAACVAVLATIPSSDRNLLKLAATPRRNPILVRSGEQKQMIAESPGIRMSIPVTCLQSGATGDEIRVRDTQKKILIAVVQSDSSLKLRRMP